MDSSEKIVGSPGENESEKLILKNLLTNFESTTQAIDSLEGGAWLKEQKFWEDSENGLNHIMRNLREKPDIYANSVQTLYGSGGWNRYAVYGDGTVKFIAHFARYPREDVLKRARELGFEIQ